VYLGRSQESLAEYVRRVRQERGWSLDEVERRSARSGYKIGRTHINRIELGESTNPSPKKLQALAVGLDVLEEELFARVRGVARSEIDGLEEQLLMKFRLLPPNWQKDLIGILDLLYREHVEPAKRREAEAAVKKRRRAA
jgi:transcriptional regulator with XRE-family HTH domain